VVLYNLVNGVMFCFLAGAMITVSATALSVWFDFPTPALDDFYPNSAGWVLAVLVVGVLISGVAAYGYRMVARVANIAAPWMVLVFLAFGLIALRDFMVDSGTEVRSPGDLWRLANTEIWRGGDPLPGKTKFGFFHIMFFAWFCNMAMHIGMSDLTVFRYARKSWYAIATAGGMYIGHFMAWLSASMLFAFQLRSAGLVNAEAVRLAAEADGLPAPLPGPLAHGACGLAGLLCVVIAGWTTANPTIYRAGLAFQAILPQSRRFTVTIITGMVATVAATFPALAMKLLEFVALYGMLLMPMGAVVFVDFWLMKRLNLTSNYAERTGRVFNLAAFLTWLVTLGCCLVLVYKAGVQIYFVSLPGWFIAVVLYIALSRLLQRAVPEAQGLARAGGAA
jgi:purine-cytosine permease-like protein